MKDDQWKSASKVLPPYSIRVENPTSPIFFTDWIFYFGLAYSLTLFFPFCHHYRTPFFFNSPQQKRFKELKSFKFQLQKSGFQIIEIGQEKINDSTFSDIYQYHIRYFISCHLWISHEISIDKVWILYVMHTLDAYTNVLVKNLNF